MVSVLSRFPGIGLAPRERPISSCSRSWEPQGSLACASGSVKYNYLRIEIGKIDLLAGIGFTTNFEVPREFRSTIRAAVN
jgi:hypothetical protein